MGYYEFTIDIAMESRDALIERMAETGCLGAVERDGGLIAYFQDIEGIDRIKHSISSFRPVLRESGLDDRLSFDYTFISERDWNESWKKKFQPIDVGDIFSILPPWERAKDGRINLIIDPGMAFGTGHHETTRTCLLHIERLSPPHPPLAKGGIRGGMGRFLDVGTGTGILAIAASLLGYAQVTGVDIDPLAVDAATRNAGLNNLDNIEIRQGSIQEATGEYDFIAANLLSDILIGMAHEFAPRMTKGGIALLSGMLTGQEMEVIEAMEKTGLAFVEKLPDGRWVSVVLTR
ncbi:MAG TPA: 50S ribosomal protein L11 methyltransferase [Dissulfurispiraceae bacterium]